jgi:glycosyltransferase involved in cell wall biosynthesis
VQILFIHPNFPAQFGHIAVYLAKHYGFRCSFLTRKAVKSDLIDIYRYAPRGGATAKTHYCSRAFENYVWNSAAVLKTLMQYSSLKPDAVVAHSGFGTAAFADHALDCPIINYCEFFYEDAPHRQAFRPGPPEPFTRTLRSRVRNTMMLLDLHCADRGYCPTEYQRSAFPAEYQHKLTTLPDPVDMDLWRRRKDRPQRKIGGVELPAEAKVVTYVTRGFEAMRGFDKFVEVADRICRRRSDVVFLCVGSDKVSYGNPHDLQGYASYKEMVLAQVGVDRSRFIFTGLLPQLEVARALALSDLHIYFTEPFVLSWSLLNALAAGCVVLASDTAPVREMICSGQNGLLADFFDTETFAQVALDVLANPTQYAPLGVEASRRIERRHAMDVAVPRLLSFVNDAISCRRG